ncbi:cell division protein FtsA [Sphingomonas koreensis]|jgi:cell division protein FtsA|uniref:Cell division protein FtsA n=1 Tax=Sphingomonas koreensis TaxID=93064 RepID=A0A1L6JE94_9SPHN|nr:cell division protein FtsA [Sphingomonas koreensis]APR54244.1 cell division protein FtsA [Sphingomonas koreensis]MDC7809255.1 cell division protein FtsA [Sphingomonas koreensis]PJI90146.1 cell division protein FtsA [Sphingomonas koreensis]RSU18547.1 cell division protein FtsA [Sphingomonas koreensis]RSU22403.1 cell division protein FtsA [Sphingomonas koreensis]
MAKTAPEGLITALDIGSSKVSALIAQKGDGGELVVLGTGQRESRGVQRGYVADMHATEIAVREAVEQAERIAGTNIEDVWVSFSAGGLVSDILRLEVDLGGHRVEQSDIDDLLRAGRESINPGGRMVLHAQPTRYTLDGLAGVKQPIGLHAERLGVDIHVVSTEGAPVRNLDLCVRSAHLEVKSIIAAPVATGLACLSEEERELGVALVEIGAGVTNVSVYKDGVLTGLSSIPSGSADITDDIASAFGTRRGQAERMKCFYGSANMTPRDNHDMIDVAPIAADEETAEGGRITRAQLIAVIRQRLDRLMAEIRNELAKLNFEDPVGRQIVLTGGGAELKGIADYAQQALGRSVRVGRPRGLSALPEAHAGPAFATLAGLASFAAADPVDLRALQQNHQLVTRATPKAMFQRMIAAFRANY